MLLKLKNVKKNYKINKNEVQEVLKDINLTLKSAEFVCIYGESGSGKSTLMNIIGGLDDDYIGTVTINKKDIKKKGNKLILSKSYIDVKNYKSTIKNYLKAVVDYTYILNKNIGFWENQYYSTVETINEQLESLTNELLSEEKENLDISSTIDTIQGLLIDIYK